MTKKVRLFLTMLMLTIIGSTSAWGQEVTYDFTGSGWTASDGVLTDGTVTITGEGSGSFKMNGGYFMLGKQGAYITLPAYSFDVEKIEVVGRSGASGSTKMNVFVGDEAICDETTGSTGTNTYNIPSDYQAAGTQYTIKVTSSHNAQFTYIKIYKAEGSSSGPVDPTVQLLQERVGVGQTMQISYPEDLDVTFASTDNGVATVSETGLITGEAPGTATISAIWNEDDNYNSGAQYFTITVIEATTYEKVTDANQLVAGNEYILVAPNNNKAMGGVGSNIRNSVDVTISDDKVNISDEAVVVLTLGGSAGAWTFLASDNNEYLALTANSNALHSISDASENTAKWVITDDFQLQSDAQADTRYLRYNSGSPRFACYKSGQNVAVLFVKSGSAVEDKASAEFAFSETSASAQIGEEFTAPTLSYAEGFDGTIVYSSSDENVATIDQDGEVTIVGAGTTTITASSEATENFQAGSASYTLTVTEVGEPMTIADVREKETGDVLTVGVVTSVNGTTAYIQDETAAIVVYGNGVSGLTVGDEITVSGTLTSYRGLLEIGNPTVIVTAQGITVTPTLTAIADISNDNQAQFIRIENATVTAISSQNVTIAQGEDEVTVRFNSANDITFAVGDVISLDGNIGYYNAVQIANPTNVEIQGGVKYYLAGSMTDWADNKVEMTKNADGSYTLTGVVMAEGAEFKILKMEAGSSDPVWLGGQADGNQFWLTAENHTNIPLVNGANFYMPIAGTWDITVSFDADNNPLITVDGSWPRKQYYVISDANQWDMTNMPEMTYNESKGVYEYTLTFRDTDAPGYNFAIADQQMESENWDDFNYNHRYSVQSGDYTLTENNSTNVQLSKVNGTMMVYNAGTYTLTLTEDLKLTVSGWPIVLDGNAYVKVTSTDDLTDGHYLIVYEGNDSHSSVAFDGSYEDANGKLDAANNIIDVTIAEKLIVANDATNAAAFIIEATGNENEYTIKSSNDKYIGKTANANGLDASETNAYTNTISFEDGEAIITASGNCTLRYNYASDQQRFRYYKSGQQPIALYKLTTVDEIPVTIGSTGYSTLYYSDKALAIPEGMTAQYVSQVGDNDGKITFTEINNHFIPKNTAVVLKATQGSYTFFEIPGSEEFAPADNLLLGTDAAELTTAKGWAENLDCKFYMLSRNSKGEDKSVGFYFAKNCPNGEAFTNGAHKAYLAVPKSLNAKSCYLFSEAEIADGIGAVESPMFNTEDLKIYNLNGQRVSTPQRGIYIINGKKVLVK